ncbi:hypothetical protein IX51_04840 [uncultured archaeon]|nr:hypothetical protein IX51_04840 [uncultured archaeon]HKJ96166.1 hypothetical protein [Thermoplasmataceae archaeon]
MKESIIRTVALRRNLRTFLKGFFKSTLNDSLVVAMIAGIFMISISGTMHPMESSVLSQNNHYYVTPNVTSQPAFTLFSNKITYVKFQMPQSQEVNYSLLTLTEEHVKSSLANPGGIKLVWKHVVNGTASDGTIIAIPPPAWLYN